MAHQLTEAEMRTMWAAGDPLAEIAAKARIRNGLSKRQVREIVFGADEPGSFPHSVSPDFHDEGNARV